MKAITLIILILVSSLFTFIIGSILINKLLDKDPTKNDAAVVVETDTNKIDSHSISADANNNNQELLNVTPMPKKEVLSLKDEQPVEDINTKEIDPITPTKTPTKKPTPKISPTISISIPSFTSEQIYNLINSYSGKYGVDPNVIRHVALCESGFNPMAKNWIYGGLFQFSPTTWESWRRKMNQDTNTDLRYHAEEAIETATYAISLNKGSMWPNCMP